MSFNPNKDRGRVGATVNTLAGGARAPAKDNLTPETLSSIREKLGDKLSDDAVLVDRGQTTLVVDRAHCHDTLQMLHDELGFDSLSYLTAVDLSEWPEEVPDRYAMVYGLVSIERNERVRVECFVDELEPTIPTASDLWGNANWLEREVWDMFGIKFEGHSNLIRLVCPENMKGFPLRKDYPLTGMGEREDFPVYHDDQP